MAFLFSDEEYETESGTERQQAAERLFDGIQEFIRDNLYDIEGAASQSLTEDQFSDWAKKVQELNS